MIKAMAKWPVKLFFLIIISSSIMFLLIFDTIPNKQFILNEPIEISIVPLPNTETPPSSAVRSLSINTDNIAPHDNTKQYIVKPLNYSSLSFYSDKSVIFVGMISNAEPTLPHILEQLNQVTCLFNHTFFLFFESNSKDNTGQLLQDWSTNSTLKANSGQRMQYCYNLDHTMTAYPNTISKKLLRGGDWIQKRFAQNRDLSRIDRFVVYRNMLLEQVYSLDLGLIDIDYILMIDLDVWEIDFGAFLSELRECPHDIMCVNGVEYYDYYRDSFASVEMNHNWIHRPYLRHRTKNRYMQISNGLRQVMPRTGQRFEQMQSCFNGLTAYKITPRRLEEIGCNYLLNEEVRKQVNFTDGIGVDFEWLTLVNRLIEWSDKKGIMFDTDTGYETNLCEHISFHYCVNYRANTTMAVAKNAKLYYYPLMPKKVPDDNPKRKRNRHRMSKRKFNQIPVEF